MIVKISAAIFTALFLIRSYGINMRFKRLFKVQGRVRPLDCEQCLSAWLGLMFYFLPIQISIACMCMFGSGWLIKYLK